MENEVQAPKAKLKERPTALSSKKRRGPESKEKDQKARLQVVAAAQGIQEGQPKVLQNRKNR